MSRRRQRFIVGLAGTIRAYPGEGPLDASPAPTVQLLTPSAGSLQAETAATANAISTTLGSAAVEGDQSIVVASATGIVRGSRLWIERELIRVALVTGTTLTLTRPLDFAHPSGAALKGQGLTYALTTTHTATRDRNYRAVWRYYVDAVLYTVELTWDVVRTVFRLDVQPGDLAVRVPDSVRRLAADLLHEDVVDQAQLQIETDLVARSLRPDLVRSTDQFRPPGIECVRALYLDRAAAIDASYRETAADAWEAYESALAKALLKIDWYDVDDDDTVSHWTGTGYSYSSSWDGTQWVQVQTSDEQGTAGTSEEGFAGGSYMQLG